MADTFPITYLARHGETEWSRSGQHTGRTDIPLTERGERNAIRLGERLRRISFANVWTSPSQRARRTCELAGFANVAEVDADLTEWDYGDYEGVTTPQIHTQRPGWCVFRDGAPAGESPEQVAGRADRVIARIRAVRGNVLIFSSGHFLRVLGARWIKLEPTAGRHFLLDTASLSALSYYHDESCPAIRLWNDTSHVEG